MVHVDLGTVEAILPPEEQVPGEEYTHGSRIRVYVTSVAQGPQGPADHRVAHAPGARPQAVRARGAGDRQPASSRSCRSPARPGTARRSRCARPSPAINAKGACIGELGQRVRAVTAELNNEKIDIVDYVRDLRDLRRQRAVAGQGDQRASSSTQSTKAVRALVPDYQLSLAIGKEGQNARLAAKLTGAKIDIQPDCDPRATDPLDRRVGRRTAQRCKMEPVQNVRRMPLARPPVRTSEGRRRRIDELVVDERGRRCPAGARGCIRRASASDAALRRRAFGRALRVSTAGHADIAAPIERTG